MEFPIISFKQIIICQVLFLIACGEPGSAGTDVETKIDPIVNPLDSHLVDTLPIDSFSSKMKFQVFQLDQTPWKNGVVQLYRKDFNPLTDIDYLEISLDTMGSFWLDSSFDLSLYSSYASDTSNKAVLFASLDSFMFLQAERVFSITVQSEFIYGGGEADSAYFYVEGSPLIVQCSDSAKTFSGLPKNLKEISVENKYRERLVFPLPPDLPDSVEMILIEKSLHLLLDPIKVLESVYP